MEIGKIQNISSNRAPKKSPEEGLKESVLKKSDTIEISSESRTKALILKHLSGHDPYREEKIKELKKKIQRCQYEMSDKVIECLVANLILNL